MAVTDSFAPNKDEPVKGTSKDWFDAEITEKKQREISYSKTRKNLTCMSIKITTLMSLIFAGNKFRGFRGLGGHPRNLIPTK